MRLKLAGGSPGQHATQFKPAKNPWLISPDDYPVDGTPEEQLWFAVSCAVLAPSTHNTQPWRFVIHGKDVDLLADFSRAVPVVDPERRELIISCGAALFYLRLTLRYFGHGAGVLRWPDPNRPDWLARVHMGAPAEVDAETILLFQAIPRRSTNRHRFRDEVVPQESLTSLASAAELEGAWLQVIEDEFNRAAIADLIAEGDRRQWADKQFRNELAEWVRPTNSACRDGLPVATQDLGSLMSHAGPLVIRTFDLGKGHAAKDHEIAMHSPVLAVLGTAADDPAGWLAAGQALAKVLLQAQSDGLVTSFLNQPIELADLRPCLSQFIAREGTPQLLLRMGYGDPVRHTPRRGVGDVVEFTHPVQ